MTRSKLIVEQAMDGEISWDKLPDRAPHCDPRILHFPDNSCTYCQAATNLQEERVRLDVSNTGHRNRLHPCPADLARSRKSLNSWGGNVARSDQQITEDIAAWRKVMQDITAEHDKDKDKQ